MRLRKNKTVLLRSFTYSRLSDCLYRARVLLGMKKIQRRRTLLLLNKKICLSLESVCVQTLKKSSEEVPPQMTNVKGPRSLENIKARMSGLRLQSREREKNGIRPPKRCTRVFFFF